MGGMAVTIPLTRPSGTLSLKGRGKEETLA